MADEATGNYLCVDYFRLQYVGPMDLSDYATMVQTLVDEGQKYLDEGIQDSVSTILTEAMTAGRNAIAGKGTDADGNVIYDETALSEARAQLMKVLEAAEASREL